MKRKRKKRSTYRATKETSNVVTKDPSSTSRAYEKQDAFIDGPKETLLKFDLRVLSAKDLMQVSKLTRKGDPKENLLDFEPFVLLENLPNATSMDGKEREVTSKVYALNRTMNENMKDKERYEQVVEEDEDVAVPVFGRNASSRNLSLDRNTNVEKDENGVDLRRLFWCVEEQGGWEEIRNSKGAWSKVMKAFDPIGSKNLSESYLESLYRNRSLPFRDRWLREGKDGLEEKDVHRNSLPHPCDLDGTHASDLKQDVETIRHPLEEEISCQEPEIEERAMETMEEPETPSVPFDAIRSLGAVLSARETVLVEPDSDEEVAIMFR